MGNKNGVVGTAAAAAEDGGGGDRAASPAQAVMDIVVLGPFTRRSIDVAVVNASAPSYIDEEHGLIHEQLVSKGMETRENQKKSKHRPVFGDAVERLSVFVPFVVEITGKLGPSAKEFLQSMDMDGWSVCVFEAQLGALVMRYNAMTFLNWIGSK